DTSTGKKNDAFSVAGYALMDATVKYDLARFGLPGSSVGVNVNNLFDREYVGSVIVNESNGRYYEPAPGRNYGIGLNLAWRFE
ncbi:TonB-dependent receptor, partial [Escherichia coli]|uniref:TonB-dependent receptor n=1 Tax=Escherichia coli TaxID=562 RepID=UPI0020402B3F